MTAYLVYLQGKRAKAEAQIWYFDRTKALKTRTVLREIKITDEEAANLTLEDLQDIYGRLYIENGTVTEEFKNEK